jgi:hypothetical protein
VVAPHGGVRDHDRASEAEHDRQHRHPVALPAERAVEGGEHG